MERYFTDLGNIVATKGVYEKAERDKDFLEFVMASFVRYCKCDWGDVAEEDRRQNDDAVENGERVAAAYTQRKSGAKIYIITEQDRSVTTILFPEER